MIYLGLGEGLPCKGDCAGQCIGIGGKGKSMYIHVHVQGITVVCVQQDFMLKTGCFKACFEAVFRQLKFQIVVWDYYRCFDAKGI